MQDSFQNVHAINSAGFNSEPLAVLNPWYRRREFRTFIIIFLLFSISGLVYCFSRPAVFRSSASLTLLGETESNRYWSAPEKTRSDEKPESDYQHIAIQSRILTDPRLLQKVWGAIENSATIAPGTIQNFNAMRTMLSVESIPDTKLVELRADGLIPAVLPVLVNSWIETYQSIRSENIDRSASSTNEALTDQLETLKNEISSKRKAIELFRQQHGIMSEVREENPVLSKLTGLNEALNLANEEAVKANSKLESVQDAISRGEPVFLDNTNNSESLAELEKSAQKLREDLAKLEQQYTQNYIRLVPDLRAVPDQLQSVEAKIARMGQVDQERVLSIAQQESRAADQKALRLQRQLAEYRQTASKFTARFSEYKEQQNTLQNLETHYRSTEDKILRTEIRQHQKYPDIEVISEPFLPQQRIAPNYLRDAGIVIATSFLMGLFGVWITNILVPKTVPDSSGITLSGIHMYPDANNPGLPPAMRVPQLAGQQSVPALAQPVPRDLTESELQILWDHSPLKGKQLIGVLLSGITIEEAAMIEPEQFDNDRNTIEIPGDNPRSVLLSVGLRVLFGESSTIPAWRNSRETDVDDLSALLACLATDADIPTDIVSPEALRHTYLMFLVRQGVKLSELTEFSGYISPSALAIYRTQSPRGQGKSFDEIDPVHPLLKG